MTKKMMAKGIRIAQPDIDTVEACQEHYGLGTFSDAIRFIIREWRREKLHDMTTGLAELQYKLNGLGD